MDLLGAHVSIAGGIHNAVDRGVSSGCGVIQIFTQNSNQWKGKAVSPADAQLFRDKLTASGLSHVVSHDIYLINLAAAPGEVKDKSLIAFKEEMQRCAALGIDKIVMHPGSHTGDGEETGIRRICEAFDQLFAEVPEFTGKVLLENTAGQGTNLGYRFDHLKSIIEGSSYPTRFGVCFDTCHAFASGYPIADRDGYRRTFDEFDSALGIDKLMAFHLNDSKKGLGCKVDRHEHIGAGALGLEPFRFILNDPHFKLVPKFIETPKGDADEMDVVNLKLLRSLVEG
ncbi:endodeoxyribonuclease IV [Citrifermentans bemidjiense Bem]|uniref:Probable endonuclease 4 n=1 Tax=Citrifermentans bemidjiense (strain ATCC BAA-1014 / DSM 16622 / JCM 12645 / Bem) TaxID=404380 RepID=END4_CITBB|nr:deoxyribonuclease IV [Citrifermentans bemidjiense]B5EAS8.1 RecName: Full=Probable endonuclease 4; AltName: Full=Endodeoxyribonuclease IV; AltName: Full=Endonuclease IV [Citrifermentans bemidjiense Bem]ACH37387.1 endodeoxyribonuclease IV [Citrifermentans bemidjiense Bem]